MSTGVKAAAFAAFARVFLSAFEPLKAQWGPILWVVAAATMIVGTVVGVAHVRRQTHAGVFEHRPWRVSARGAARGERLIGKGAVLFICSRTPSPISAPSA